MPFENCIDFNQTNATHETSKLADSDPDDIRNAEKTAWLSAAGELAEWSLGLLNRSDAWLIHDGQQYWKRTGSLDADTLCSHFLGSQTLAIYSTDPADNSCWWLGLDIDQKADDDTDAAELNRSTALAILERCHLAGLAALLEDSNGNGGFHVWVRFSEKLPAAVARSLGRWLTRDLPECEIFPKQDQISKSQYGNALRIPGRHATRNHWSRFWHEGQWLSGPDAVACLLSFDADGNDPRELAEFLAWDEDQRKPLPRETAELAWLNDRTTTEAEVIDALEFIPADDRDDWLRVGMALRDFDPSYRGYQIWDAWSQRSHKYNADEFRGSLMRARWDGFGNHPNPIRRGTLFYLAKLNGWQPPIGFSQSADYLKPAESLPLTSTPTANNEEPRDLADYRDSMIAARIRSLREPASINLDRSPTGSGKGHAEIETLRHFQNQEFTNGTDQTAVMVVPGHAHAAAEAERLNAAGINAVTLPKLDADTCGNYENAKPVQDAGLPVSLSVCMSCRLRNTCEYKRQQREAAAADVQVMTHARAAKLGLQSLGENIGYLTIHEDPADLLRPKLMVESLGLFAKTHTAILRMIVVNERTKARGTAHAGRLAAEHKFLSLLESIAADLLQELQPARDEDNGTPKRISLEHKPRKPPRSLWRKFRKQLDLRSESHGLPLLIAAASGNLKSLIVNDQQALGFVANGLPENAVVWINDATADRKRLQDLIDWEIIDRTPTGRLAWHHEPVQIPREILKTTAGKTIRGIVAGYLAQNPTVSRLGIIVHQNQIPELAFLPPIMRDRIAMVEHWRSGHDVGSNDWLSCCDALLILGSPRVPPAVVRESLIHADKIEAAQSDGDWSLTAWEAYDTNGETVRVERNNYRHKEWRRAAGWIVKDRIRQAVGRGRGLLEQGIPVTIVTNEDTGYRVSAEPLRKLSDRACEILQAIASNSAGMKSGELALYCEISESLARRHLRELAAAGLIQKTGNARSTEYQAIHQQDETATELSGTKLKKTLLGNVPDTRRSSLPDAAFCYGISPGDVFIMAQPVFPESGPPPTRDVLRESLANHRGIVQCQ